MKDWVMSVAAQARNIYERLRDYGYSDARAAAVADEFIEACYAMRRRRAAKIAEVLAGLPADLRAIVEEGPHGH